MLISQNVEIRYLEFTLPSTTISSSEMRALETNAEYFGVSLLQLMENAGRNIAEEIVSRFKPNDKIIFFCGLGGNGGDGFVAARHLLSMDYRQLTVFLVGKSKNINHESARLNWLALQPFKESIIIKEVSEKQEVSSFEAEVIVDSLLGTGTKGKIKQPLFDFVGLINSMKGFKIAVDVPTGVDSDTGEILGEAVKADLTVTFHKAKNGLKGAKTFVGKSIVSGIGLPTDLEEYAGPGDVQLVTKLRPTAAHKGDFGRLLLVGGSETFSGAPVLMSLAALRTGVDLAFTASPEKTAHDIASISPDLISIKLEGTHLNSSNLSTLKEYLSKVDAVVLGPGLGLHAETKSFVEKFVKAVEDAGKPMLLDADGLKAFAEFKRKLRVPLVLTPHAGEFAILTGGKLPDDMRGRIDAVKKAASQLGAAILLKGATDIVSDGKRLKLNFTGNPGMTVGGTGDVLSGVVGALLSQKVGAFEAATAGAFINGAAGDFVASKLGYHMVATDLLEYLPKVINDPMSHLQVRNSGKSP